MIELIYLLYIAVRFGFLAKRYRKNIFLWVVLSGIFYVISLMFIAFNIHLFSMFDLMPKLTEMNENYQMWIPVFAGLFVAFGVYRIVEKNFRKDKQLAEEIEQVKVQKKEEAKRKDLHYFFHAVNPTNVHHILPLAKKIWSTTYDSILSQEQIDYMIPMMYDEKKILSEVEQGECWEILKVDNISVGYLHYKLEEDGRVFLSKIYLDSSNQQQGLGKIMLAHVTEFAESKSAKAIYLTVNKHNAKAISFYERNNFVRTQEAVFEIGNGYVMDDYIYQKNL